MRGMREGKRGKRQRRKENGKKGKGEERREEKRRGGILHQGQVFEIVPFCLSLQPVDQLQLHILPSGHELETAVPDIGRHANVWSQDLDPGPIILRVSVCETSVCCVWDEGDAGEQEESEARVSVLEGAEGALGISSR
jgi:hypothetical protein